MDDEQRQPTDEGQRQPTDEGQRQPTDEELEARLREEIKRLRVVDVAGEVMVTLVTLGYQKLGLTRETLELRHLPDARLAIELLRGLIETLEREQAGDVQAFRSTLAAMQLQYARVAALPEGELPDGGSAEASTAGGRGAPASRGPAEPAGPGAAGDTASAHESDDASRAAEKLWVPPGAREKKRQKPPGGEKSS
jgi:hypothetical protein